MRVTSRSTAILAAVVVEGVLPSPEGDDDGVSLALLGDAVFFSSEGEEPPLVNSLSAFDLLSGSSAMSLEARGIMMLLLLSVPYVQAKIVFGIICSLNFVIFFGRPEKNDLSSPSATFFLDMPYSTCEKKGGGGVVI